MLQDQHSVRCLQCDHLPGLPLLRDPLQMGLPFGAMGRLVTDPQCLLPALRRHLDDEQYRALQTALYLRPEQGALIPGGGGLRKLRWGAEGRGKRGGVRTIYYWAAEDGVC